ncbi:14800_t:CDS:2 [Dentiscutata heterogama]|uniref:14800_t:CDS:1 n=1 Tax=Dentiscutata heterogama TaxID=1316150 RepID=A0ACA9KE20_9GLOM|nr:14800_t:CDS:2 [Dentiscutata heterogama]
MTIDDALDSIEGENNPQILVRWPNNAYLDFMELVIEGNISNKIGDKIIKFFNKHSNLEESPLSRSTKSGKDYLSQIRLPSIDFKEKDNDGEVRVFGEQYECDWWHETEKTIPPINHLLSVMLYSDAMTFDNLVDPLLKKPDGLYFGVQGRPRAFAAWISVFLADMLKASEITATYKAALKKLVPRTPENIQQILNDNCGKEFSIHNDQWSGPLVKRKELILTPIISKAVHCKVERFGKVLWELKLDAIDEKVKSLKSSNQIHPNYIEGLSEIVPVLYAFLDTPSQDSVSEDFYVKVYDTVYLESGEILRTSDNFQGKEWFSNVAVSAAEDQIRYKSDEGICMEDY